MIIKPKSATIGAETGSVFVEYVEKEFAEKALNEMTGRLFDRKEIRVVFINEEAFNTYFR